MTADAPDLIDTRLDALLARFPPGDTAPDEFLGAEFDMGLAWIENPDDLGGLGLPATLQRRVSDRLRAAGAPMLTQEAIIAVGMAAPVLLAHGTDRQRTRHLRPIFTGEEIWCQLFSEPGAGSDLAGLATSAVADGDEWVVNGQKVWTSFGDIATFGLLVARTDPTAPKHRGLTYFILDMRSPGVEVCPLRQITGDHEFSEVFLTDVRVPDSNRVGEANRGWPVVVSTLMNERSALGDSSRKAGLSSIERAVAAWHAVPKAARDSARRDLLLRLWSRAEALRRTVQRVAADREGGTPGPDGSVPKLLSSLLEQQITEFVVNLQGASALLYEDDVAAREFLYTRMTTIAGGTSEILRNIIGERILGLPPDIQIDRDVPWRDVARDGEQPVNLDHTPEDVAFGEEVRAWMADNVPAGFTDEAGRTRWERTLGAAGWIGLGWPVEHGGQAASVTRQSIYNAEYVRANAPPRLAPFGEELLGPTLIAHGTPEQQRRFLPGILAGTELWCQGYSEPNAGSDLASVQTRAVLDGNTWVVNGQKVWTTNAHLSDWCFVLCRTDPDTPAREGLSYILVPMDQPGVTVRPLRQMTGSAEFNEVFLDDARTAADLVVGRVNDGWRVAMATLGFERGAAALAEQLRFERELWDIVDLARKNGAAEHPVVRQRLSQSYIGVQIMGYNALRVLSATDLASVESAGSIGKLYWSTWYQRLGELAIDILGPAGQIVPEAGPGEYELDDIQRAYMFARAGTIYAGSSEIQKNIIGERVLGLPREPRPTTAGRQR